MATAFENFALADLVKRPEDALRLASLAAVEGRKIRGYAGNYFQYWMGDASVIVRTLQNYDTNESELYGMDTHAASDCVWECTIEQDITPPGFDPLERRLLVAGKGKGLAVVDVVNADVLPAFYPGTALRLNLVGFPRWVDYLPDEAAYVEAQKTKNDGENLVLAEGGIFSCGYVITHDPNIPSGEMQENFVQIRGRVKDVKVGETYMGLQPMTTFIRTTVETSFGDVELCHTAEQVAEEQKEQVKAGAIVSALCILSGDAAIGEYAGGICCDEERDLLLLRNFFEHGGADRLRPALHSECVYTSDYSGKSLEGVEATIALLKDVEAALDEASRYYAYPAHLTGIEAEDGETPPPYLPGKKCLLLAQGGPEQYVALCFVETDSVGRIRTIRLSQDGRYRFERDDQAEEDPFAGTQAPKDALEAMLPWAVMGGLIREAEEVTADTSSFPAFEAAAKAALEKLLAAEEDWERALPGLFGELFLETAGRDREKGEALYDGFHRYRTMANPSREAYQQQLLNALVLVQRFGELYGRG